eukprot:gene40842-55161_t
MGHNEDWSLDIEGYRVGTGIVFVTRATLDAVDAQGQSLNVGSVAQPGWQVNIEAARDKYSVLNVTGDASVGYYYHTNTYRRLAEYEHVHEPSSVHRLARLADLPPPRGIQHLVSYMSDTYDKSYPIYRGHGKDGG